MFTWNIRNARGTNSVWIWKSLEERLVWGRERHGPVILWDREDEEVGPDRAGEKEGRIRRADWKEEGRREGRGMRLAFDTACQRPEGWSGSRQPDRRIISGIRSKTLLETLLQTENTRQKGFAAPCVERDTSQDAVYQKRSHLLSSFYL